MKRYIIFEDDGRWLTETGGMQSWDKTTENRQKLDWKIRKFTCHIYSCNNYKKQTLNMKRMLSIEMIKSNEIDSKNSLIHNK